MLRRAGRVWTGVDRVELAYLAALIDGPVPVWGLARTPVGYVLLDRTALIRFHLLLTGNEPYSSPDLLSRMVRGLHPVARAALTDARKLSVARCLPGGLAGMLRKWLPVGVAYLNTGHSNLSARVLEAVRAIPYARIAVFVHDVIPMEYPHYQREGTVEVFEQKMRRVRAHADLLIYNSEDTRMRTERVMAEWGAVPQGIVAHLGTTPPVPDPLALPEGVRPESPYFITVGTIEPRKNHALLLDVWENLGSNAPMLLICGGRGWNNAEVFARLDALAPQSRVREISGLEDRALAALVQGAQALLFPSHAEGFGLPAVEALMLGTPVICTEIATFREILGKSAVYVDDSSCQLWHDVIVNWSKQAQDTLGTSGFVAPSWEAHFKITLRLT
ncbi:glycosyltransferase family 4 protein [Sulfitobacter guttiformis]|uniref:Glycosyl transferase family 1 n=1 Tax=Sulfitobacter guttiformis TaxID=74349 RepID=A0A420DS29_9RHOB|nr:glycosyltransferase family 1 protein [Sulfitobacter guttiformis]KIN74366.1 Glycosyl transferase, group 1 [Sulfitobacter guttiformis KCTC 32187]RKE96963.1 glycosyl transferase family 1 [Sulfitobacter guttiformis]